MEKSQFLWGAATSAHQVEGNNLHSDWWRWESEGRIAGGVSSGLAADHWSRQASDLKLAVDLGLNTYRFSIEWAKIEPQQGNWSEEALQWYDTLLDHCESLGLLPMVTLHHFTLPDWLAAKGGFSNEESVALFTRFVDKLVDRFGSRIPLWCTFNEPMVLLIGSYIGKFMPPALFAPDLFAKGCQSILKAHVEAYKLIHEKIKIRNGPWKDHPIMVGIAHNMLDFLPDRWWHPLEQAMGLGIRRFYNRSWLDALTGRRQHFGIPFFLTGVRSVAEARGRNWIDFVGVNYYTKGYLQWRPKDSSMETLSEIPLGIAFARRKEEQSDLGWGFHPSGFASVLREAARYKLPIFVTENGIADRDDRLRKKYLFEHLRVIAELVREGLDIRGYYHWSLLDNFEWIKGFAPRFGLYHVDYQTFERTPRQSAHFFKKIVMAHQQALPPNLEILENFRN